MLTEHMKLMALFSMTGEVVGRKKLQKMVYIAKKAGIPFSERYHFHRFGPYSDELTVRMEELCNLGFVEEMTEDKGHYSQYRYQLSEEGRTFLEMYGLDMPLFPQLAESLNEQSARFLELVSTMLYFSETEETERKERIQKLKRKQNYTEADFAEATTYIRNLIAVPKSLMH
ncbi:YwgA family protein [Shouchella shacheensis]|uniref:YwgA family protein n=1 Tax=Shouchella shacheensis TaxID=1649580 RepID=UPI000740005D|nr:hypothetical protein [Shouchella shacheensis]